MSLFAGLCAQSTYSIPFDWAGQNGIIITEGALFWNRSWTSGMLLFDGTYSNYPQRYGTHTSNQFQVAKTGKLPAFHELPDSNNIESFFDYYSGDYLYNQLEVGADFEEPNKRLGIRGFKRTHGGNTGHYLHPSGGSSPIHHSYRVDYAAEKGEERLEASAGRFVTRSGLPDSTTNGLENENIFSAGLRYQRPLGNWILDTYVGQFFQHRLVHHSSMIDSNYRDINRNRIDLLFQSPTGLGIGLSRHAQQINADTLNRSLSWTTFYAQKEFAGFNIRAGVPLLNSNDKRYLVWDIHYQKQFSRGFIHFSTSGMPNPIHPDMDNPEDKSNFEYWTRFMLKSGFSNGGLSGIAFTALVQKEKDEILKYDSKIMSLGGEIQFDFGKGWSVYNHVITQLDTSIYGGGYGTATTMGIRGKITLFKKFMKINAHLWGNGTSGRLKSYGFDPIRQIPFRNSNSYWELPNRWLLHFEAVANISGVLITYKVNNILNAVSSIGGSSPDNELIWARPNHVYPQLGRMMQFGVTWTFKN